MDPIYPRFALAHREFYDDPGRRAPTLAAEFTPNADCDWTSWAHHDDGNWSAWSPASAALPDQGWKVHVSATLAVAAVTLSRVSRYCHAHSLVFKHLPHRDALFATNAKDADRSSSGKFLTIYPRDLDELRTTLEDLESLVGGMPGPHVLSDLRWRNGPLSVRYGAFAHNVAAADDGEERLMLTRPDGVLVEDLRTPGFTPPDWVTLPRFLEEQRDALGGTEPPPGFPLIHRALHYSNAGGVYEAEDPRTGAPLIAKEARPHAGITSDGRDAIQRLHDEETVLRTLAGLPISRVNDSVVVHGHRFLMLEKVDGESLQQAVVPRNPLIQANATPADYADYGQWALDVAARLEDALDRLHAAGYTHGDLHPGNVMVTRDGGIVLVDFEMAKSLDDDPPVVIGAPGFTATDGRRGRAADRYGLACTKLFLFFPVTPLIDIDPAKAEELLLIASATFALDKEWIAGVRRDLALPTHCGSSVNSPRTRVDSTALTTAHRAVPAWDTGSNTSIRTIQHDIATELTATADYSREDRLWPGDPRQFAEPGTGLAHGAAGVIYAQWAAGVAPDERAIAWLDTTMRRRSDDRRPHRLGLWNGLAGVAWLNRTLGRHTLADQQFETLRRSDLQTLGADLYGGLPGIGLTLLEESDANPSLRAASVNIAELLREKHSERAPIDPDHPASRVRTGTGGLMRGASGTALFALRLYERTGDADHLRLAEDTLDYDLAHCMQAVDGSLQMNEGWRLLPYLAAGSAGVGLVAAQSLSHTTNDGRRRSELHRIQAAASTAFVMEPGLFQGRAGLIFFLAALTRLRLSTEQSEAALARHVAELRLHAIQRQDGIGFPGQGLLRLSCDLATGSAGVLAALEAYAQVAYPAEQSDLPFPLPLLMPFGRPSAAGTVRDFFPPERR